MSAAGAAPTEHCLPLEFSAEDLANGLLRGVPVHEILAGGGKHWKQSSQASEAKQSWAHSVRVERNFVFASHSWKSSRWLKWLSLCAFFNGPLAAAGGMMAAVLARVYTHYNTHVLHALTPLNVNGTTWEVPVTSVIGPAGFAVGLVLFFQGHRARQVLEYAGCSKRRTAFLDKLVIHQGDKALMDRGIHLLGAFIKTSDNFLVLWSEHYLERLWCSYEIAVFAFLESRGHGGQIVVWPLPLTAIMGAKVAFALLFTACILAVHVATEVFHITWPGYFGDSLWAVVTIACGLPSSVVAVVAIVQAQHNRDILEKQVASYSLKAAQCSSQADRAIVEGSVVTWFDPENRDREVAIPKFDKFVQSQFSASIGAAFSACARPQARAAFCLALMALWLDTMALIRPANMPSADYASLIGNSIVQDVCGNMLGFTYQLKAVAGIDRHFRSSRYLAVPQQDHQPDQINTPSMQTCRFSVVLVETIVYTIVGVFFQVLAFCPASLPLSVNIIASFVVIAWTVYEYL